MLRELLQLFLPRCEFIGGILTAAAGPIVNGIFGSSSSGGSSPAAQTATGAANIAGGMLSATEAQQFANSLANTANPFGQYNSQFAGQLAGASANGGFGNSWNQSLQQMSNLVNQGTTPLTNALNGQGFAQQINNLVADPSSIYNTPQYQAAFGQGQNAVNSTLAAQGLNASGNQLAALQSYGQSFGQNAYNTDLSQLSGLYGQSLSANQQQFNQINSMAQQSTTQNNQAFNQLALMSGLTGSGPAASAAAQSNVFGNVNAAYGTVGQGIGQVASGVGNLLNGLSSTSGSGFSSGLGTTTSGFGDVSGSGALYGTSAGTGGDGYTYSGSNSYGFTGS